MGTDNEHRKFLAYYHEVLKHFKNCDMPCLYFNCNTNEKAILSHVYQNNKILSDICDVDGNLMEFRFNSLFQGALPEYKPIHRNKVLAYKGFCNNHDTTLFKEIEPTNGRVDWSLLKNQSLIAYRTLCREVYIANLAANVFNQISHDYSEQISEDEIITPLPRVLQENKFQAIIQNLIPYKHYLETYLESGESKYLFYHIELPFKLELCIAATISGTDKRGICFKYNYQEMNIVNIFPYNDKTIILLGYDPNFENIWVNKLHDLFQTAGNTEDIIEKAYYYCTAIVDVLLRTDFHCMSTALYNSLDKSLLHSFLAQWNDLRDNFSFDISSRNCLFYETFKQLLK